MPASVANFENYSLPVLLAPHVMDRRKDPKQLPAGFQERRRLAALEKQKHARKEAANRARKLALAATESTTDESGEQASQHPNALGRGPAALVVPAFHCLCLHNHCKFEHPWCRTSMSKTLAALGKPCQRQPARNLHLLHRLPLRQPTASGDHQERARRCGSTMPSS